MTDKKIAVEGQPNDQSVTGSEEPSVGGGQDMVYDSGIFIAETDPDDVQYGTRIDAPLVAGSKAGDDWPVAYTNQLQGAFQQFADKAHRDKWTSMYKSRLFNTIAVVGKGENDYPSIYHWTGTKQDGSDGSWEFAGYFGGIVLADADGAIPALRATIVLGDDFSIEEAGDNGLGALVQLSDALKAKIGGGGDGLISVGTYLKPATFSKGTTLEFEPPLQAFPDADKDKAFRVTMQHGYFEAHHAEGYLAYFDNEEVIIGTKNGAADHKGVIWADKVAYGKGNVYLYEDRNDKAVILQETDMLDPNVTGGTPIICGLHLGFVGKAFEDGQVKAYLYDRNLNKVLTNKSGQPIGVVHSYKQGQEFEPLTITDVYIAKGSVKAAWYVTHTFNEGPIKLKDLIDGDSCVLFQALDGNEEVSTALNQYQILTGKKVEVERKYYGDYVFSTKWALSYDMPEQTIGANAGEVSNLGLAFLNPDPMKSSISGGIIHLKDDGTHMGYFMLGTIFSAIDTKNMRGKTITAKAVASDAYDATRVYMVKYVGDVSTADMYFLKGSQNMQPTLASGWTIVDSAFRAEDYGGGFSAVGKDFVIPSDADLIAFMVGPQDEQSPMDVQIKQFYGNMKTSFTVYDIKGTSPIGQHPLKWNNTVAQFHTGNKRWTINKSKTNLPFGERKDGSAPVNLKVSKDDSKGYVGGLELEADGTVSIRVYVNMYLGESASKTGSTTNFWVEDVDGNKIPDSDAPTTTIKAGDHTAHHFNWEFPYSGGNGDELILYAQSSVDDGAYVQTASYDAVGTLVNFKDF